MISRFPMGKKNFPPYNFPTFINCEVGNFGRWIPYSVSGIQGFANGIDLTITLPSFFGLNYVAESSVQIRIYNDLFDLVETITASPNDSWGSSDSILYYCHLSTPKKIIITSDKLGEFINLEVLDITPASNFDSASQIYGNATQIV